MSARTIWTCDGCGVTAITAENSLPASWERARILVERFAGLSQRTIASELCSICASRYADWVDPRAWPRAAQEAKP